MQGEEVLLVKDERDGSTRPSSQLAQDHFLMERRNLKQVVEMITG